MTTANIWQTETGQAGETAGEETEELSDRPEVDEDCPAAERRHGILRQRGLRRHMGGADYSRVCQMAQLEAMKDAGVPTQVDPHPFRKRLLLGGVLSNLLPRFIVG